MMLVYFTWGCMFITGGAWFLMLLEFYNAINERREKTFEGRESLVVTAWIMLFITVALCLMVGSAPTGAL